MKMNRYADGVTRQRQTPFAIHLYARMFLWCRGRIMSTKRFRHFELSESFGCWGAQGNSHWAVWSSQGRLSPLRNFPDVRNEKEFLRCEISNTCKTISAVLNKSFLVRKCADGSLHHCICFLAFIAESYASQWWWPLSIAIISRVRCAMCEKARFRLPFSLSLATLLSIWCVFVRARHIFDAAMRLWSFFVLFFFRLRFSFHFMFFFFYFQLQNVCKHR